MNKVDQICETIIRELEGNETYSFEKQASEETLVVKPHNPVKMSTVVNFRKIASEIREAAKPVEITNEDVNEFIKEAVFGFFGSSKKEKKKTETRKQEVDRINNAAIRRYAKQQGYEYEDDDINKSGTKGTFYDPSTGDMVIVNHKATGTDSKGRKL
jgi:hypothetical protein